MKFERFGPRVPADAEGPGRAHPESLERGNNSVFFESLLDLKQNLIPWMRNERINKVSVYAYAGDTSREVGHFIVSFENNRTTITEREGTQVSLFGMTRATTGRSRSGLRTQYRVVPIARWLSLKGVQSHTATFDVFPFEAGDEEQTEQEAEIEARAQEEGKTFAAVVEEQVLAPESTAQEVEAAPEPIRTPKIKGRRQPKRKKPIKAERKARLAETMRSDYKRLLEKTLASVHQIRTGDADSRQRAHDAFDRLARFLDSNPELKSTFRASLSSDSSYAEIRVLLTAYLEDEDTKRVYRMSAADKYMRRLAAEVLNRSENVDPFRSRNALNWRDYTSTRDLYQYFPLFAEQQSIDSVMEYLHSQPPGKWLDIGSGEAYRVPLSLMNAMRTINPGISVIGVDPLYKEELASLGDRALGRHRLDPLWSKKNELVSGTAQDLPFPDQSFNEVLSYFAFDKFNEDIGGTEQALRQVARVLKPGGKFRVQGLDVAVIKEESVLYSFFRPIEYEYVPKEDTDVGKRFGRLIAERLRVSADLEEKLARDISEWLEKYTYSSPMAK